MRASLARSNQYLYSVGVHVIQVPSDVALSDWSFTWVRALRDSTGSLRCHLQCSFSMSFTSVIFLARSSSCVSLDFSKFLLYDDSHISRASAALALFPSTSHLAKPTFPADNSLRFHYILRLTFHSDVGDHIRNHVHYVRHSGDDAVTATIIVCTVNSTFRCGKPTVVLVLALWGRLQIRDHRLNSKPAGRKSEQRNLILQSLGRNRGVDAANTKQSA